MPRFTDLLAFGYWFGISKPLYHCGLKRIEVEVLSYLINHQKGFDKQWFFCTVKRMKAEICIGKEAHSKALRGLQSAGVVETKWEGIPAKRMMRFNQERLQELWEKGMERLNRNMQSLRPVDKES
jgi:hypothetical protein